MTGHQSALSTQHREIRRRKLTIFDKALVNVYDTNDTVITVSKGAILLGFRDPARNVYRISLVDMV
jgi:hypothetical protein